MCKIQSNESPKRTARVDLYIYRNEQKCNNADNSSLLMHRYASKHIHHTYTVLTIIQSTYIYNFMHFVYLVRLFSTWSKFHEERFGEEIGSKFFKNL